MNEEQEITKDNNPGQRKEDNPSTVKKTIDRSLATGSLVFSIAFLYQMTEVLKKHTCWCDFTQPAGVGEITFAFVCGLAAIACALGLDVQSLIKGFKK